MLGKIASLVRVKSFAVQQTAKGLSFNRVAEVRVRFAPSPTGKLHLGGLRTALYNYLFAKANGGKFVIRIEDTDRVRCQPGCAEEYDQILKNFGLVCDEGPFTSGGAVGPYFQSKRQNSYLKAAKFLLDKGNAYRCFCSVDRLEMLRREAIKTGSIETYDNRCRDLTCAEVEDKLKKNVPHVLRFKLNKIENFEFFDHIFGNISHPISEGDFVLIKSDSYPTYHLANVVDDHEMRISHVIRGMEWLTSMAKHLKLYEAFDWKPPEWVHLPLMLKGNKKKLSKRDEGSFVKYYTERKGYLPLAVLNYLLRNGSGIKKFDSNHLYTLDEMIESFDISTIGRRNILMDQKVLDRYGRLAFQNVDMSSVLVPYIQRYLNQFPDISKELLDDRFYVEKVVKFLRLNEESFACFSELIDGNVKFFFSLPNSVEKILQNFSARSALSALLYLSRLKSFNSEEIEKVAEMYSLKRAEILQLLRLAFTDSKSGPPIRELIDFFGVDLCRQRIDRMVAMLSDMS